jgi:hypothetical protein
VPEGDRIEDGMLLEEDEADQASARNPHVLAFCKEVIKNLPRASRRPAGGQVSGEWDEMQRAAWPSIERKIPDPLLRSVDPVYFTHQGFLFGGTTVFFWCPETFFGTGKPICPTCGSNGKVKAHEWRLRRVAGLRRTSYIYFHHYQCRCKDQQQHAVAQQQQQQQSAEGAYGAIGPTESQLQSNHS